MLTLFTLPNCPRCEIIKSKLEEKQIIYKVNLDPDLIKKYEDNFWPLLYDDVTERLMEFPDILVFLKEYDE
jgi:glutaredoxin